MITNINLLEDTFALKRREQIINSKEFSKGKSKWMFEDIEHTLMEVVFCIKAAANSKIDVSVREKNIIIAANLCMFAFCALHNKEK